MLGSWIQKTCTVNTDLETQKLQQEFLNPLALISANKPRDTRGVTLIPLGSQKAPELESQHFLKDYIQQKVLTAHAFNSSTVDNLIEDFEGGGTRSECTI